MIIMDKKKAMMTIMSKRNHKDGSVSSSPMQPQIEKDESGEVDGRHAAAQDMIQAFHEKDAHKLAEAMANFHDLHMAAKHTEPEVPEQPDSES